MNKKQSTSRANLSLVPETISHDTIELLEQLLDDAKRGRVLGVAFVAMRKRREFIGDVTGEAYRNPVFARGMIAALDDYLAELARS